MDHLESVKPIPQYYTVNHPLPSELEFPGCKPVHLPRDEIETYEGRLEFWDARTETAWVCEPTSPYREQPSQTLALWCMGLPGCEAHRSSAAEPGVSRLDGAGHYECDRPARTAWNTR